MSHTIRTAFAAAAVLLCPLTATGQDVDAPGLYKRLCASCHDTGLNRAPQRDALLTMTAERVLTSMETGTMVTMANNRTAAERRALAEFLAGKRLGTALNTTPPASAMCGTRAASFEPASAPRWTAWGGTSTNTRFQDAQAARL